MGDQGTSVIDWQRTAPLLEHVELAEVLIASDPQWADESRDEALENLGYEALAYGERGPLILRKREEDKTFYYVLFDTDRSTLPYRLGFPIMVSNLVRVAMHETGLSQLHAARTGVLPPMQLTPDTVYRVMPPDPDGKSRRFHSDTAGRLAGIPATQVGRYRITGPGNFYRTVGINLLDETETHLESVQQIQLNEYVVAATPKTIKMDHSLWPKLALLALAVLMIEWWFYHRRPGGPGGGQIRRDPKIKLSG